MVLKFLGSLIGPLVIKPVFIGGLQMVERWEQSQEGVFL